MTDEGLFRVKQPKTGKNNWHINLGLSVVTFFLALLVAEYVFRLILFGDSDRFSYLRNADYYAVYPHHRNEDFYNEDYWKLNYLFNRQYPNKNPHPLLGWVGTFDRETLLHRDTGNLEGRRPVLLYGDSFARCIDSVKCFEEILNNDSVFSAGNYLLNYGVGGYGVDQIFLLMKETMKLYENPYVIFSFLTTDLDRSLLAIRDAPKPRFILRNDSLVLTQVPLTQSTPDYIAENPPGIRSYLWNKFCNSPAYPCKENPDDEQEYISQIKKLNSHILREAISLLKESGNDFILLVFQPETHVMPDWRLTFVDSLCQAMLVPYILERDIRMSDTLNKPYDPFAYAIKGDGHPTSHLNRLIAEKLKQQVLLSAE